MTVRCVARLAAQCGGTGLLTSRLSHTTHAPLVQPVWDRCSHASAVFFQCNVTATYSTPVRTFHAAGAGVATAKAKISGTVAEGGGGQEAAGKLSDNFRSKNFLPEMQKLKLKTHILVKFWWNKIEIISEHFFEICSCMADFCQKFNCNFLFRLIFNSFNALRLLRYHLCFAFDVVYLYFRLYAQARQEGGYPGLRDVWGPRRRSEIQSTLECTILKRKFKKILQRGPAVAQKYKVR